MTDEGFPTCPVCRLRFASDAHLKDHISLDHPSFDEAVREAREAKNEKKREKTSTSREDK